MSVLQPVSSSASVASPTDSSKNFEHDLIMNVTQFSSSLVSNPFSLEYRDNVTEIMVRASLKTSSKQQLQTDLPVTSQLSSYASTVDTSLVEVTSKINTTALPSSKKTSFDTVIWSATSQSSSSSNSDITFETTNSKLLLEHITTALLSQEITLCSHDKNCHTAEIASMFKNKKANTQNCKLRKSTSLIGFITCS